MSIGRGASGGGVVWANASALSAQRQREHDGARTFKHVEDLLERRHDTPLPDFMPTRANVSQREKVNDVSVHEAKRATRR
jgi:hypothetical protein